MGSELFHLEPRHEQASAQQHSQHGCSLLFQLYLVLQYRGKLQQIITPMQQTIDLLEQIRLYLLKHPELDQAYDLMRRIDLHIEIINERQQGKAPNLLLKHNDPPSRNNNPPTDSSLNSSPIDAGLIMMQPRMYANLHDMFVLEHNFATSRYDILTIGGAHRSSDTINDRHAISELIIGHSKYHVSEKEKTSSMTELHKLTANISQSQPVMVIPNYLGECTKYTYIFESKECVERRGKYYLADRYYCFVADGLVATEVTAMCREFRKKVFEARLLSADDPFKVNYKEVRASLEIRLAGFVGNLGQYRLKIEEPGVAQWVEQHRNLKPQGLNEFSSSLLVLITYLALSQHKIVLLSSKNSKHKFSDLALSLEGCFSPYKYVYPVVFCTLNEKHEEFIESPVPILLGYWGSENRRKNFTLRLPQYMHSLRKSQNYMTVIEVETYSIVSHVGLNDKDLYIVEKMNNYIHKYVKGKYQWQKINTLLKGIMREIQSESEHSWAENRSQKYEKIQWMKFLREKIASSHIYQNGMGF